jgi:hypothetical protein
VEWEKEVGEEAGGIDMGVRYWLFAVLMFLIFLNGIGLGVVFSDKNPKSSGVRIIDIEGVTCIVGDGWGECETNVGWERGP